MSAEPGARPATPAPDDVPRPVPGTMGLAGAPRPDIARFLHVRGVHDVSLSPDGSCVSFLTATTGQPQLWSQPVDGGAPQQLTFGESSVTFQEWSPAGEWIAYGTDRGGDEREGFYLVSRDGLTERELLAPGDAFRVWGGWSPDGRQVAFASTERNGEDFDVYVMDVAADGSAGAPRRVHEGTGGTYVASWRPDCGALVLTRARGEADNDAWLLDLATGATRPLFVPDEPAAYAGFEWHPSGRGFYVVTNEGRDLAGLAFHDLEQGTLSWEALPPHEVEQVALSHDGRWLAWTENAGGWSVLQVKDRTSGRLTTMRPALPAGVYALAWAPRAPLLAVHVTAPAIAGDVWTLAPYTGRTVRATQSATGGLDPARFASPETVRFPSWDGETIHGFLYLPRDLPPDERPPDERPPVLLSVHGGPTAQARPEFDPAVQYLLTRGIAVLDLNFRGSTGYGKRFTHLDDRRLRPHAVQDLAGALDWLATTGRVDVARAAVMGGSYGGFLTFAALTMLPERFRAGVGFVGVSNWITALEGASPQLRASDRLEYGDVDDPADRAFLAELSPITHVDRIRAPLMVLHGANDPRDPVDEADQLVAAIRARGGAVEYLRFPDEGHGIRRLANRVIAWRRIAAFLERTLGVAPPA